MSNLYSKLKLSWADVSETVLLVQAVFFFNVVVVV